VNDFGYGELVAVNVDWLGVPVGAVGEVVGFGFEDPVTYFVDFTRGVFPIPAIHLSRTGKPLLRLRDHLARNPEPLHAA
jgi:hypothetical protein